METLTRSTASNSVVSRIRISPPEERGDRLYCEGELQLPSGQSFRIFFDFTAPTGRPDLLRPRPFLLAFLVPAMQVGAPLELDLPVDAVTRNNLMEWQEAMASWNPKTLKVVPILAPLEACPKGPVRTGRAHRFFRRGGQQFHRLAPLPAPGIAEISDDLAASRADDPWF